MEVLNLLLLVFSVVALPVAGAAGMIFSRQLALRSLRLRQSTFRIGFSDTDVRIGQVISVVIGAFLLVSGLINAAETLFP